MNTLKLCLSILLLSLLSCNSKKEETSDVISNSTTKAPILGFNIPASSPSDDDTPSFSIKSTSGFFNAGTTFKVYTGANCSSLAFSGTVPNFSEWVYFTTTMNAIGSYTFSVSYIDFFGIESACSNALTYVLTTPATPTSINLLSQASPSSNPNPRIRVNGTNGNNVEVYLNNTCSGTPFYTNTSSTFTLPPLEAGTHQIYVQNVTSNGSKSSCSPSLLTYESLSTHTVNFTMGASFLSSSYVHSIQSADVDNDGNVDYAFTLTNADGVLRFGNGAGVYANQVTLDYDNEGRSLKIDDVNGDGRKDLLIGDSTTKLHLYLNNGARSFTKTVIETLGLTSDSINNIETADINGDGFKDIVFSTTSSGNVYVKLNNGDGTFQAALDATGAEYIIEFTLSDVDNDGDIEIIEREPGSFKIYSHTGAGSFALTSTITTPTSYGFFKVRDMSGDNFPELIYGNSSAIKILMNDTAGGFGTINTLSLPYSISVGMAAIDDVDADGNVDIVVTDISSNTIFLGGVGDGTLKYPLLYPQGSAGLFTIMDYDNNGLKDIVGKKLLNQFP